MHTQMHLLSFSRTELGFNWLTARTEGAGTCVKADSRSGMLVQLCKLTGFGWLMSRL